MESKAKVVVAGLALLAPLLAFVFYASRANAVDRMTAINADGKVVAYCFGMATISQGSASMNCIGKGDLGEYTGAPWLQIQEGLAFDASQPWDWSFTMNDSKEYAGGKGWTLVGLDLGPGFSGSKTITVQQPGAVGVLRKSLHKKTK